MKSASGLQDSVRWWLKSWPWRERMCLLPDGMLTIAKGDVTLLRTQFVGSPKSVHYAHCCIRTLAVRSARYSSRSVVRVAAAKLKSCSSTLRASGAATPCCLSKAPTDAARNVGCWRQHWLRDRFSCSCVEQAAADFNQRELPLDILVNNAAAIVPTDSTSVDGIETTMATNHFGPFLFTHRLLPALRAAGSARVVYVSSLAELSAKLDFDNLTGVGCRSDLSMYASSKVAMLLTVQELQKRLAGTIFDPIDSSALIPTPC